MTAEGTPFVGTSTVREPLRYRLIERVDLLPALLEEPPPSVFDPPRDDGTARFVRPDLLEYAPGFRWPSCTSSCR